MDLACALDAVSLPVELSDGIIDYLADDRSSLRTTSLVCRAWCPRSRSHLFHTVHVKAVRKSFRSFLAFLNHNDQRPQCSPPISRLIRCLHLYGSRRCDYRPQDGADEVVSTITSTFLVDLFAALPGLKELSLEAIQFDTRLYPAARLHQLSAPKFELDFLSMKNVWTVAPAGDDFTHVLSMFTRVGTLRIVTPFWPTFPVQPMEAAVTPPIPHITPCFPDTLEVTRIEACARMFTPYLLSLMRRTPSVGSLREVDVACRSMVDVEALGNFFEVAGPTLGHVTLDLVELFSRNQIREFGRIMDDLRSPDSSTFRLRSGSADPPTRCMHVTHLAIVPNHSSTGREFRDVQYLNVHGSQRPSRTWTQNHSGERYLQASPHTTMASLVSSRTFSTLKILTKTNHNNFCSIPRIQLCHKNHDDEPPEQIKRRSDFFFFFFCKFL